MYILFVTLKIHVIMAEVQLDCKNLNCPMPIVKISRAFKQLELDDTLEVTATDPAFQADVEAWVRKTGNELLSFDDQPSEKIARLKKLN